MWVFEENVNGRKLTDIINMEHENIKYLPGYKLPENVVSERRIQSCFSHYARTVTVQYVLCRALKLCCGNNDRKVVTTFDIVIKTLLFNNSM